MSKHNNSTSPSSYRRCKCGRYMSIAEYYAGIGVFSYECPNCSYRRYAKPLTREEYYEQFKRII